MIRNHPVLYYLRHYSAILWLNTIWLFHWQTRAHVGGRFGRRSRLVAAHFASCQKRSGSRPVILPSRFANFNCFNSKTSVYFYYNISDFQTALVKGRNRNSYEYKNCTTDPYSGKITLIFFHFIYLGFDGGYPKGLLTLWIWLVS